MIERGSGNMLTAEVDALVNPVNTDGVMGKGLALQFKKAFPDAFVEYERACKAGDVAVGSMHVVTRLASPRFIINFPTKKHWRHPSKLEYVRDGLQDLVAQVRERGIRSLAVPPLGCGNGGLDWSDVRPLIVQAFETLPDVLVVLFEPTATPLPESIIDRRDTPTMTASRAAVIALMDGFVTLDGLPLNAAGIVVSNLRFVHTLTTSTNIERVEAGFTMRMQTPNGMTILQSASTTHFLQPRQP